MEELSFRSAGNSNLETEEFEQALIVQISELYYLKIEDLHEEG